MLVHKFQDDSVTLLGIDEWNGRIPGCCARLKKALLNDYRGRSKGITPPRCDGLGHRDPQMLDSRPWRSVPFSEQLRRHEGLGNRDVGMWRPRAVQLLKAKLHEFVPHAGYKLSVGFGILRAP